MLVLRRRLRLLVACTIRHDRVVGTRLITRLLRPLHNAKRAILLLIRIPLLLPMTWHGNHALPRQVLRSVIPLRYLVQLAA